MALIVLIGGTIAALAPFDLAFAAITHDSLVLRVVLFVALASIGALCANHAGFRLHSGDPKRDLLVGTGAAIVVTISTVLIDGFIFRGMLPAAYAGMFSTTGLAVRWAYFMTRAFNENVFYRLFLFSLLACAFGWFWKAPSGRPAIAAIWTAMVIAQVVNIGVNVVAVSTDPVTPLSLLYDALRYIAPGVLWAYLFARFGFATAEVASVGCHVFLQPALGLAIP